MGRVRDGDDRHSIYNKYFQQIGDLVRGTVKDFLGADILVDLGGGVDAILPRSQQTHVERLKRGEQISAVITKVTKDAQRPQEVVELSRRSPVLLRRLFEKEVDEISRGKVVIKAAARAAGARGMIAVTSVEPNMDPVAVCIGTGDSHIRAISRELRGEKIEVIEWSDEPTVLAVRALAPARVSQIRVIDTEGRVMEAIVTEDQLELVPGKEGDNPRVASELVGWRIHITPENET